MSEAGIHELRDAEKLALHVVVAQQLRSNPDRVIAIARENLRRWQMSLGVQPYYERWLTILNEWPIERIVAAITADDQDGRSLRQSTPFVGVIDQQQRDDVIRLARVTARAKEALGDKEKASRWLEKPNRRLGGRRPLELIATELGALEVERLLGQIEHGNLS